MFVRFSKKNGSSNPVYRKAVAINNTYLIQEGNTYMAYAYLHNASSNPVYRIFINGSSDEHTKDIERYTKRFIGNSFKWEKQESKRRKYEVHYIEKDFMEGFTILHTIKVI